MGALLSILLLLLLLGHLSAQAQFRKTPWPQRAPTPALDFLATPSSTSTPAKPSAPSPRGVPILLNFWATWCEPCKQEMPSLDVLADWQGADRLRVVAVDVRESSGRAERFMADRNLHLHVLQDPDALIAKRFGVSLYPTTVLIDAKGRARWKIEGPVDWSSAEAQGWIDTLDVPGLN